MKYLRWVLVVILILVLGYFSAFGLFADSNLMGTLAMIVIFVGGCAAVGALIPERWLLSALCSWGAVLFAGLELLFTLGRDPIPGQQPTSQVLFTLFGAVGLALLGGYLGYRVRTRQV